MKLSTAIVRNWDDVSKSQNAPQRIRMLHRGFTSFDGTKSASVSGIAVWLSTNWQVCGFRQHTGGPWIFMNIKLATRSIRTVDRRSVIVKFMHWNPFHIQPCKISSSKYIWERCNTSVPTCTTHNYGNAVPVQEYLRERRSRPTTPLTLNLTSKSPDKLRSVLYLTLQTGRQEEQPACIIWMMRCWRGYPSRVRCRCLHTVQMVPCIPKPHHLLPYLNPDWFYLWCRHMCGGYRWKFTMLFKQNLTNWFKRKSTWS